MRLADSNLSRYFLSLVFCFILSATFGCGGDVPVSPEKKPEEKPAYVDPGMAPDGQKEPDMEKPVEPKTENKSEPAPEKTEPSTSTDSDAINLEALSWDGLQNEIKKHQGKVVVVDMWAFTCIPCKKEFPHFVELQKMQGDKIVCISVNCDYQGLEEKPVDSYKNNALKFLKDKKAELKNIILNEPQPDVFSKISLTGLPAVYVYKKDGTLAKRFDYDQPDFATNGFTYKDHINPLVSQILAE